MSERASTKGREWTLIRSALIDAIGWQEGLADAYAHIPRSPDRRDALRQADKYRRLLAQRYGVGTPDDKLAVAGAPVQVWPPAPQPESSGRNRADATPNPLSEGRERS